MRRLLPAPALELLPLAGFYALYYAGVGITLPFLPAYLKSRGLSATQVGILLALGPCMALVGPPLWGNLADRTGRSNRVLLLLAAGAACAYSTLLWTDSFPLLVPGMLAYGFFSSSVIPLLDSLTLQHVATRGGAYAHVRLFGSLGFIASSTIFGLVSSRLDRAAVLMPLALMVAYGLWTLTLPGTPKAPSRRSPFSGLALLRERDLVLFLSATSLHWLACAPYHGVFSIHLTALGLAPAVVGTAAALGVAAEVVVMVAYPRFAGALSPRNLMALAFAVSALRWLGMSLATGAATMLARSLLHAFTFGAFYVSAVAWLAGRVPPALRSSGQGLFSSATFGVGGLLGYALSGRGYDLLGGHRLFAVAALVELAAAVLILRVGASRVAQPDAPPA